MKRKNINQNIKNWILLLLSLTPVLALMFGGYVVFKEFIQKANENVGLTFQEMHALTDDKSPVTIDLDIQVVNDGKQTLLKYAIGDIFVIQKNLTSEVCINGVFVQYPQNVSSKDGFSFQVEKPDFLSDNLCVKPQLDSKTVIAKIPYSKQELLFKASDHIDESFFPFDEWGTASTILWLDVRDNNGNPVSIEPRILSNLVLPDWNGELKLQPVQITVNGQKLHAYQVDITLHRLVSIRFFTILLIVMSLLAITTILFMKETSTAIELSLAILLGLWGIQGILIPASIQGSTLVHLSIILLYVYLVAVTSIRFFFMPTLVKLRTK